MQPADPLAGTKRKHGTYSGSKLCVPLCERCAAARRAYATARRRARGVRPAEIVNVRKHGIGSYNKGERTPEAREAARVARARQRAKSRQ